MSAELTARRLPQWLEDLLAKPSGALGSGELGSGELDRCRAWAATALWESGGLDLWAAQAAAGTGEGRSPELEVIPATELLRRRLCTEALLCLALRLLEDARTEEGLEFLEQALRLGPEPKDAPALLARVPELLRGKPEENLPPCVTALLARVALQKGEQEEGLRRLDAIAKGTEGTKLPLAVAAPLVVMEATIGVHPYSFEVPFGVVHAQGHRVAELVEKPVSSFTVSTGIYVLNPSALELIPDDGEEFPITALFNELLRLGRPVGCHRIDEDWLDVGNPRDLLRANGLG